MATIKKIIFSLFVVVLLGRWTKCIQNKND